MESGRRAGGNPEGDVVQRARMRELGVVRAGERLAEAQVPPQIAQDIITVAVALSGVAYDQALQARHISPKSRRLIKEDALRITRELISS